MMMTGLNSKEGLAAANFSWILNSAGCPGEGGAEEEISISPFYVPSTEQT